MLVHSHNTLQAVWQHNMSRILYVTLVYCGQMVAWIRRPLGTKVVPSRTVLDGDQAPPNGERHSCPSTFLPMSIVAKRSPILATAELLLAFYVSFYFGVIVILCCQ